MKFSSADEFFKQCGEYQVVLRRYDSTGTFYDASEMITLEELYEHFFLKAAVHGRVHHLLETNTTPQPEPRTTSRVVMTDEAGNVVWTPIITRTDELSGNSG